MARDKATVTLDRAKVRDAMDLVGGRSMSEVIDVALDRVIKSERLRGDVAAYAEQPLRDNEVALGLEAGLVQDSVANFDNTLLLDRSRLVRRLGRASAATMEAATRALAHATGCRT